MDLKCATSVVYMLSRGEGRQRPPLIDYKTSGSYNVSSFSNPRKVPGVAGARRPYIYYKPLLRASAFESPNHNFEVNDLKGSDILDPDEDVVQNFNDPISKETSQAPTPGAVVSSDGQGTIASNGGHVKQERVKREVLDIKGEVKTEPKAEPKVEPKVEVKPEPENSVAPSAPKKLSPQEYRALAPGSRKRSTPQTRTLAPVKRHKFNLV